MSKAQFGVRVSWLVTCGLCRAGRPCDGGLVTVHDVVAVVRTLLQLSDAAFVREPVMPAIADGRFQV
ncbi:hypothetical protein [Burkholderia cepacia]|uniref:hypothetical protein n=1 Tax=Burkholderia cepacia TaxID=292 RepID=UPI002AB1FFA7|nr:hypothetical protein [Burkholderia cepacia]